MHQWNELPVLSCRSFVLSATELRSPHLVSASEEGDSPKTWGADWSMRRVISTTTLLSPDLVWGHPAPKSPPGRHSGQTSPS